MPKIKTTKSRKYGVPIEIEGGQWYAEVPVDSIQPHPDNPNHGDIAMIRESIQANDFYGACVVQATSGRILAGEHRWRAAIDEGRETIPVIYRDCDDHTAIRILLVDNETARAGEVDPEVVGALLATIESVEGSGYSLGWLEQQEQQREAEEEAAAEAEASKVRPGKAAMVDDTDLDTVYGIVVVVDNEKELEAAFEFLSDKYGADKLRTVSV